MTTAGADFYPACCTYDLPHSPNMVILQIGMLVIASLFVSTSSNLPQTSYMKLIDVWMIFCFMLPFFEVILHTMVEYLADNDGEAKNKYGDTELMYDIRYACHF